MIDDRPDYHCLIVGAGFSGIGAAIKLDQEGFGDYLIVEAGDDVGGTWYWNTYPGIAVDIPSSSYQFSFEQRPDWSRTYARGNELKAYAEHCADKYGIRSKIRFNTKVLAAEFDDERSLWRVQLDPGGASPPALCSTPAACSPCRSRRTSTASTPSAAPPCTPPAGTTAWT